MVRTASAAAVLIFAAGLAPTATAQAPAPTSPPPTAEAAPIAAPPAPPAPHFSISDTMRAQAAADAPAPPPPPVAAPSVAVAAAPLAPAVQAAFAAPPASVMEAARAAPVAIAVPVAPAAAPVLVRAVVVEPAPAAPASPPVQVLAAAPVEPAAAPVVVKALVVEAPPPAPRAPEANAFVAHRVTDAAGAFDAWTEKAARIDGKFADGKGVSAALADVSAVQTEQLEEGAVAYGALAALQDPVFVQSAHDLAALGGDHDAAAAILLRDPAQVMTLPGADGAAVFTAQALSRRALAVTTAGKAVRQAAYSMQISPWARDPVPGAEKRLADAKARSSAAIALDGPASGLLMKRLVDLRGGGQSTAGVAGAAPTPLVTRSLALAAMIVLGEADEAHVAKLTPLLSEAKSTDCLKMAKLNLFQCLSVAGPHYEDAFCVGEHGLGEAGQCLAAATGVTVATPVIAPVLVVAVAAPPPPAGVAVPIALLSESGPERRAAIAGPAPAPVVAAVVAVQAAPPPPPASVIVADVGQPTWAREAPPPPPPPPQIYARQEEAPAAAPRYDQGQAYPADRQPRTVGYVAPAYGGYGYVDPRQAYGRYAPARPAYNPADEDDDDAPAPPPRAYPPRGYWNDR